MLAAALEVTGVAEGSAGGLKDSFDVLFDGKPTGAAGLWMDRRGRPERRQQTVNFPGGRMCVEERYTWH